MRRTLAALLCAPVVCGALTGCTLMPAALQPHQLWKLNRQPASGRDDAFFSVADPWTDDAATDDATMDDAAMDDAAISAAEEFAAGEPTPDAGSRPLTPSE